MNESFAFGYHMKETCLVNIFSSSNVTQGEGGARGYYKGGPHLGPWSLNHLFLGPPPFRWSPDSTERAPASEDREAENGKLENHYYDDDDDYYSGHASLGALDP